MKFLLALSLISLSAFAADKNSTWEEIRNDRNLQTQESQINFSGAFVSVFNVCHNNEIELRTLKKVTTYAWVGDYYEAVGRDYKFRSADYQRVVIDGDATSYEPATYPLTYNVRVTNDVDGGMGQLLFSKSFTIPACL